MPGLSAFGYSFWRHDFCNRLLLVFTLLKLYLSITS